MRLGRDRVVREGLAGERVAHRRREDAGALVGGGHAREARDPAGDPGPLVVGEEERLSLTIGPPRLPPN